MAHELLMVMVTARVRLDWSGPAHWSHTAAGCRRCHTLTHGRDAHGEPCHRSCAEEELATELAGRCGDRIVDERVAPSGGYRAPQGGPR